MKTAFSEILSFGKTLALIAVTIVFAAMQLDSKLERFDKKFDSMSTSISELNHTMKELTVKLSDSDKRFIIIEKDIKEIKARVGMK
ncbi:MAG: hypothetical protein J7501_09130 [Bdellovibrio sp.]|nr:hypothetical protein [Bdellovibrio sp.]